MHNNAEGNGELNSSSGNDAALEKLTIWVRNPILPWSNIAFFYRF